MSSPGNTAPIGIFDSGIGGLTVARAIRAILPHESFVYFGDTAHLPYGDKSRELVASYAIRITNFLLEDHRCKAIVIACNTASAAAYETLRDAHRGHVPVINVIDPMIEEVISSDELTRVGVIATKTTVASGVYQEKFKRRKPQLEVATLATPLLASMIEEGFYDNSISEAVIHRYLSDTTLAGIQALILACTHYPLIRNQIDEYFGGKVRIFDSADVVAAKLKVILEKENLLSDSDILNDRFFVSDYTPAFEAATKTFFSRSIRLEHQVFKP
jgi:glutamate racemase